MPTRTTLMFRDLGSLENKTDFSCFLEKWGHRGRDEYELARPSFAESPEILQDLASRFSNKDLRGPKNRILQAIEGGDTGNAYDELVGLKEIAKDECIRYLRSIKPIFVGLSDLLSVPLGTMFGLRYSEIASLAESWSDRRMRNCLDQAAIRIAELAEQREIVLAGKMSLEDLEFMDMACRIEEVEPTLEFEAGSNREGRMISVRQAFRGVVHRITNDADLDIPVPVGSILVTEHLSPKLVPLFGQAEGCISQNGGMLSHAAIVAREMGFPVLVGVDISSREFRVPGILSVSANGVIDASE